jgi:hypothetical protein
MLIQGRCHCGNVSFDLTWEGDPQRIPARACGCTFCTKHGGVWTSNRSSALSVTVQDPAQVSHYTFGTSTATFHVCARCGVVPLVTTEIDERIYAVVNVNAFENVEPARLARSPADFEGENVDARLARRARNWIADVRFVEKRP